MARWKSDTKEAEATPEGLYLRLTIRPGTGVVTSASASGDWSPASSSSNSISFPARFDMSTLRSFAILYTKKFPTPNP